MRSDVGSRGLLVCLLLSGCAAAPGSGEPSPVQATDKPSLGAYTGPGLAPDVLPEAAPAGGQQPEQVVDATEPRWQAMAAPRPGVQPVVALQLLSTEVDATWFNYVVKSRIYPEDPTLMVLTLRGGGLSVLDVADPARPQKLWHWAVDEDVEGQDRLGDLLVVVGREGVLHTFDVSDAREPRPRGRLELTTRPTSSEAAIGTLYMRPRGGPFTALHTALHRQGDRTLAFVTAPISGELVAVDVTDADAPVQVGLVDCDLSYIEGISIHREHAFVGGFGHSGAIRAVDVSDPGNMRVVRSLEHVDYRQMVSAMDPAYPDVLFTALWNTRGGLASFDVSDPARFSLVSKLARPVLERSNRVKLDGYEAFLPLEQDPGGLAVVDVRNPAHLELVGVARGLRDIKVPYTLQPHGDHLYIWGTHGQSSMAVLSIVRGQPSRVYGRWHVPAGLDPDALVQGWPADAGAGRMRFLDADSGDAPATRDFARAGEAAGIPYLELSGGPWQRHHGLAVEHGLGDRTFYGDVLRYTLVWDVSFPSFPTNGCAKGTRVTCADVPLVQLDRRNERDADLFAKVGRTLTTGEANGYLGNAGAREHGGLGGYVPGLREGAWHRVALVVDLARPAGQVQIFLDGERVHAVDDPEYDIFASLAEGDPEADGLLAPRDAILLFADNDGELNAPVRLAGFAYVNEALGNEAIRALGPVTPAGIPALGTDPGRPTGH